MTRKYVLKVVDELNRLEEACNNARVNYRISEVKYVLSNVLDRARNNDLSSFDLETYLVHCLNCLNGNIDGTVLDMNKKEKGEKE